MHLTMSQASFIILMGAAWIGIVAVILVAIAGLNMQHD